MDKSNNEIIIYEDKEGITKVNVKFMDVNLWVTKKQLIEVYNTTRQNIEYHLKNIYDTNELLKESTCKEIFTTVQNKMHYAIHEYTAAELIYDRLDNEILSEYCRKCKMKWRNKIWKKIILK